ncbi:unnamed protein product [Sphagnum tenellum]
MVGSHGHSLPEIFHWIITNEGWPGLFRGNAINVIRVAPNKAIELFAYDFVKAYLSPGKLAFLPVSPIASSCAGISSTVCMYLTIQPDEYRGILDALWRIVSEEGVLELYRGLAPSVIEVIPYAGVNYFVYDSFRFLYKRCSKTDRVGNIQTLLIGSLAGAIASTSTFPLEVGALKGRVVYKGTLDALRGIAEERGLKGLYKGLGPSCFKLMPAAIGVFYEVAIKALAQTKFPHVFGSDVVIEQHNSTKGPKLQDHLSTPDIHDAHFGTPPNMDGLGSKGFADKSFDWP